MKNPRALVMPTVVKETFALCDGAPAADGLFWSLWRANQAIAVQALATPFVQGIKNGSLDPVAYGAFCVNDAYYCFHGAADYEAVAVRAETPALKAFLTAKAASYHNYNKVFPETWRVRDAAAVNPRSVTREYAAFESELTRHEAPIYTLIGMLPCEHLWAWLGSTLAGEAVTDNLYKRWITENNDFHGAYTIGNFLDDYAQDDPGAIDRSLAHALYQQAMTYEWQNFAAALDA